MDIQVPETARGKRLDHFLQHEMPNHSRSRIQEWIKAGLVLVNGAPAKASATLQGNELLEVTEKSRPPLRAVAEDIPLEVIYEDAALIAINKPTGMVVHAGAGNHSGTLVNALLHRFQQLSAVGGDLRPGIVHRLDKETSGLLLVARNDEAHRKLAEQFAGRTVQKFYLALVHGSVRFDSGHVDTPIARDPVHRTKMTARLTRGRTALTEYSVLDRFGNFSFLRVRIGTGRTHQIRVHLSSIGHPVVGDKLYGAPRQPPESVLGKRFFLHAWQLSFRTPATGEKLTLECPLPANLAAIIEARTL